MFTIDEKNRIRIIAGDTAMLDLSLKNYTFVKGDKVYFTVKNSVDDIDVVIQKVITTFDENVAKIFLSSSDTNVDTGVYVYDIQCSLINNIVDTVIPPSKFEVLGGVTHD